MAIRGPLLQAVTDLLTHERTFAQLSIDEISTGAGIAKSTFYQYFTGKNDLLRSLLDEVAIATGVADSWLEFDGSVTRASLEAAIQQRFETYQPILPLMGAAFDAVYFDAEVREMGERVLQQLNDELSVRIQRGQQEGIIDPTLPPRGTARWLNWMLSRGFHQLVLNTEPDVARELVAGFSQLVWLMLYAPMATSD